jgi:MFS family permease
MALYASAGLGLLFLPSLPLLYLFRAIQGFGWGAFLLTFNTLTLDLAPPEKRGEVVGLMGIAPPFSLAVAPLLSEHLMVATAANYRLLFFLTLGAVLLAMLLGVLFRDPAGKNKMAERAPLFSRKVLVPSLIIFCMTFNLGSLFAFLPLFGESRDILGVGYFFTIFAITTVFSRPLAGKLSDRLGRPMVFLPGLLIAAAAMVMIAFAHSALQLMLSAFFLGVGFGSAHSSVMAMAADRLAVLERGVGMATFTTAFDLGIVAGSVILGFLLSLVGFTGLFLLCALIMVIPLFGFIIKYRTTFP